jgi:AraC-like DNA-binding protein
MVVISELNSLKIPFNSVDLGSVEMDLVPETELLDLLKTNLRKAGLEVMDDKKAILIEKIKNVVIEMVHYADELPVQNFSDYLSAKLRYDYTYLSNIFSEVKGITLQHFVIAHKIEKAKELLLYDELNISEIAAKLGYSSVAHLSNQFKKVTGLSPSFFKKLREKRNRNLESI